VLYLRGGAILPVGLPIRHVGEASLNDDLSLIIALDENGMHLIFFCPHITGTVLRRLVHYLLFSESHDGSS
jgi:hypothetical protein